MNLEDPDQLEILLERALTTNIRGGFLCMVLIKRFMDYGLLLFYLWVALTGGSPILFNILHPLSNVFIVSGLIIISTGWRGVHSGNGQLITSGIYRFVRYPQYSGFILAIIGFLIQGPTLITLIMAPILLVMYTRLAKKEEKVMMSNLKKITLTI